MCDLSHPTEIEMISFELTPYHPLVEFRTLDATENGYSFEADEDLKETIHRLILEENRGVCYTSPIRYIREYRKTMEQQK